MGYRIRYEPIRKLRRGETRRTGLGALTGLFFLIFLLTVNLFWAEGAAVLRELVVPGDAAVTAAALESMSEELKQGIPLMEAVKDFCSSLLSDGQILEH